MSGDELIRYQEIPRFMISVRNDFVASSSRRESASLAVRKLAAAISPRHVASFPQSRRTTRPLTLRIAIVFSLVLAGLISVLAVKEVDVDWIRLQVTNDGVSCAGRRNIRGDGLVNSADACASEATG